MMGWIKQLFASWERQQVAAERAAVALEDIATDLESVRDALRERLGHQAPVIEDHSNGRKRIKA